LIKAAIDEQRIANRKLQLVADFWEHPASGAA
jgi:hypothetical protein